MTDDFCAPKYADGRRVEIRMLGTWQVHRSDGSPVQPAEWRTGKTADLVRMLALRNGEPAPTSVLIAALWPDSDPRHGQSSLRTAASFVRQIIGHRHLSRSPQGLRMTEVWVDVVAFRALAATVQQAVNDCDTQAIIKAATQAEELYRGDLQANDDGADWVAAERASLSTAHQFVLCAAGEATLAQGQGAEAINYGRRILAIDPFCERASRLLMLALSTVGERALAIREYERCRSLLAEELGIDPSAETRQVHLMLLRDQPPSIVRTELASPPRDARTAQDWLAEGLTVCLPRRQFNRLTLNANRAAQLDQAPEIQARALIYQGLPLILLGRPAAAQPIVERAHQLTAGPETATLHRRVKVLRCLVSHDLDSADFPALWAEAVDVAEYEPDANWAWVIMRVATERRDHQVAELAGQLHVAPRAGLLASQLHRLASAALAQGSGHSDLAIRQLREVIATEQTTSSTLLLPEALSRLALLLASSDLVEAERYLARLERIRRAGSLLPREKHLRFLAIAAIRCQQQRPAAAVAMAARAVQVADDAGLRALAALAQDSLTDYTSVARRWAAGSCVLPGGLAVLDRAVSA